MGSSGGDGPTGLPRHELKTLFLRAPYMDWAALSTGHKTEFRAPPRGAISAMVQAPTPVVLYTVSPTLKVRKHKLVVLVAHRVERLMDIADQPDSLAREGHPSYDSFRRYWRGRTRRRFNALARVEVFQLAPWQQSERQSLGAHLLDRLYGDYLGDHQ